MTYYVGILDGSATRWGVRIPDVSGCVGAGATPEEAIADVTSALREVMAYKQSSGVEVSAPSPLLTILESGEVARGETTVMIPLALDSGRTVRANLTMDAGLLEAIDEAATHRGITRSAFIASAAREKIEMVRS